MQAFCSTEVVLNVPLLLHTILEEVIIRHARSLLFNCHPLLKPRYEQIMYYSVSYRSGELLIGIQLHNNSLQWPNKILDAAFLTCHLQKKSRGELLALIMTRLPSLFVLVCSYIYCPRH